ncbi:hypothetical protein K3495_g14926 [Podosphaera aphanis]|nr:hypothetical protein K3495_g14926 [Podosphaera aphanis]
MANEPISHEGPSSHNASEPPNIDKLTIARYMKGIDFGPGNLDFIELPFWGTDPTSKSTPNHLATHVAKMMSDTTAERQFDDNLFYAYREEFEGWNIDMFATLPQAVRRQLKIFLRTRGVFTGKNNGKMAPQLMELTTLEEPWR